VGQYPDPERQKLNGEEKVRCQIGKPNFGTREDTVPEDPKKVGKRANQRKTRSVTRQSRV